MMRVPFILFAVLLLGSTTACTQAVLTPFSDPEVAPEERELVSLRAEVELLPEGALFFLDIPDWDVVGVPAFFEGGILSADFSVPYTLLIPGMPVPALLQLDDPTFCRDGGQALGLITWTLDSPTAEFTLQTPEPWVCE